MATSAYEELVDRCVEGNRSYFGHVITEDVEMIRYVLAEVLRTLETVTPEMGNAFLNSPRQHTREPFGSRYWLAMLRASPLTPTVQ
jgi:hypothetical protein